MSNFTDKISTHNDIVGTDANISRIPGAEKATSGHQYEAVFPKGEAACLSLLHKLILASQTSTVARSVTVRSSARKSSSRSLRAVMRPRVTMYEAPTSLAASV